MPESVSQYLNVDKTVFDRTGAFDAVLDFDSRFFIDPLLLRICDEPEFVDSFDTINSYFRDIILALQSSDEENDEFWQTADSLLTFPEVRGMCLGYSGKSTHGSGMGENIRGKILKTAKKLITKGIESPRLFELTGLFNDDVGCDRISDMLARIIGDALREYTLRIFGDLPSDETKPKIDVRLKNGEAIKIPQNPYNGEPIILVPRSILSNLPVADSFSDIQKLAGQNAAVRHFLNEKIGKNLAQAIAQNKEYIRKLLLQEPDILKEIIRKYESAKVEQYDFDKDPAGEYFWMSAAVKLVKGNPIQSLDVSHTQESVVAAVNTLVDNFKHIIENTSANKLLYEEKSNGEFKPRREFSSQMLFYAMVWLYCKLYNIDITPEASGGRGAVDFKFSFGYRIKHLVELKVSSNQNLVKGLSKQLQAYLEAEEALKAVYLVINYGNNDLRIQDLRMSYDAQHEKFKENVKLVIVDARIKKSASKL